MGFVAGSSVEPLEWDFSAYGAGKGVSPEPTSQQIEQFNKRWYNLVQALVALRNALVAAEQDRNEELSPEQAKQKLLEFSGMDLDMALQRLDQELSEARLPDQLEVITKMAQLIAETTGDCPSVEQIMKLPHRPRTMFFGWFVQELTDPEGVAAGTKPSLSLVHNG